MYLRRSFQALAIATVGIAAGPTVATEQTAPPLPNILSMRERAKVIDCILAERLDTVVPQIMREEYVDLWLLISREYFEEPAVKSMLDANSMAARRRTILVFYDPGDGQPIERLTVSRYGLAGLFEPSWDPDDQPNQWRPLRTSLLREIPQRSQSISRTQQLSATV